MEPSLRPVRSFLSRSADPARPYPWGGILHPSGHERAYRTISRWQDYAPTPLVPLNGLAHHLGLGKVWFKHEGERLGAGSCKALGGVYGVQRAVEGRGGCPTVAAASVGNHGRAVALGAARLGCRAVIFLPASAPPERKDRIRALGAELREVAGSYDQAVEEAAACAREQGWVVVADTVSPGAGNTPIYVMEGYTVLAREVLDQMPPGFLATHVFLQAGVGGLAAAVAAFFWAALGPARPLLVVVEPAEADGLLESARRNTLTPSRGSLATAMDCLACRLPSEPAWKILQGEARAFLAVSDAAAEAAVGLLASGVGGDPPIRTRPSGAAGLAGLLAALADPDLRQALGLGPASRVLLVGTEGP